MGVERVLSGEVLERHLDGLVALDPRLVPVRAIAGQVPMRASSDGFAGMARIIVSQLLSVASANAIHRRFEALVGDVCATEFLRFDEAEIRTCGISGGKYRTMRLVAEAELAGALDYAALADLPAEEAVAALTELKGIGPWTAEIYLLFCVGHADVFPAGDLALQKMLAHALGLEARPNDKAARAIALGWSPYRGVVAQLLWRYFAALTEKEGVSL